ncbi:Serine/threonine-protein kinase PknB [Rubripirellula obstinata]|uniref:Serine/threonine-protein kinase PknB n=1 Tax=Rubripirellula obstinata TaxID=406547 RepID=A0A5B1CDZ2_9BACT|nr:protein kinase [Rubripirellula obstinata]KAA1257810.1 Serine/threonine-protein kinase PknB [Rubripirellula obstinata]
MSGKRSNRQSGDTTGSLHGNPLDSDFGLEPTVDWVGEADAFPELPQDRYVIVEELQHGGMGVIFRAVDRQLCREVAIKLLRRDRADCVASLRDFETEAHIMSFLSHPGVTPIYDRGHTNDGRPFHVMKLIDGATLSELMNQSRVPLARLLSVFAKTCEIVAFAHSRDIVHLDLKPSNVMVGSFGEVNVMDWGLARYSSPAKEFHDVANSIGNVNYDLSAEPSPVRGTPAYMSPEQALGRKLDERTDVFGLGCILCEILTGSPPYDGSAMNKVYRSAARARLEKAYQRLDSASVDASLIRLAKYCLQADPDDRPANAWIVARVVLDHQESALSQVRNDMDRFFELSSDLFCIADFQGFFRRVNGNFSRVLGYHEHDILSKPFLDFVHPDDHEKTLAIMGDLDAGNPVIRFRNRYRTAAGDYIELEWTAKTIEEEDVIFAVAREVF